VNRPKSRQESLAFPVMRVIWVNCGGTRAACGSCSRHGCHYSNARSATPNRRESVRFLGRIVIAFDCGDYGFSRSQRGAARRLALRFFLVVWSRARGDLKVFKKTQVIYKQHIRTKTKIERHELQRFGKGLATLVTRKQFNPTTDKGKNNMNKLKYIAAVLIGIAGLSLQQAKADTYTYFITTSNSPTYQGINMVQVDVTTNGTKDAIITFTSQTSGGNIFLMSDGGAAAVNASAAASITAVSYTQVASGGFNTASFTTFTNQNSDGFGQLSNGVDNSSGFDVAVNSITFTLTRTSGVWGLASTVLVANAQGALVAAHIYVTQAPGAKANGASFTGYAANGGAVTIPDGGATVMLLGMALGALGVVRRYLTC
jgi:hypothetical protein